MGRVPRHRPRRRLFTLFHRHLTRATFLTPKLVHGFPLTLEALAQVLRPGDRRHQKSVFHAASHAHLTPQVLVIAWLPLPELRDRLRRAWPEWYRAKKVAPSTR